jgi:aspartyl protease family protein
VTETLRWPARAARWLILALLCAGPLAAAAQSISLAGRMGDKALLVIDGQTQMLAVGDSVHGVRLVQVLPDGAVVESAGVRSSLRVGAGPTRLAGVGDTTGSAHTIVIPASPGGHFITSGAINGRSVRFMVDTGATLVSLSQAEAERIGLSWRNGRPAMMQTANGQAPAMLVTLTTLRVGDVELSNVPAVVVPAAMPMVLLGNSFLSRLQMQRNNDVMRLELR